MDLITTVELIAFLKEFFVTKEFLSDIDSAAKSGLKKRISKKKDLSKVHKRLNDYFAEELKKFQSVSRDEEIVFEGLCDYLSSDRFLKTLESYLTAHGDERDNFKDNMILWATNAASPKQEKGKERVVRITEETLTIVYEFYRSQAPKSDLLLFGEIAAQVSKSTTDLKNETQHLSENMCQQFDKSQKSMEEIKNEVHSLTERISSEKTNVSLLPSQDEQLRSRLDALLEAIWKAHRSYKLMQIDGSNGEPVSNPKGSFVFENLGKIQGSGVERPVWDIIQESWRESKNRPVVIQGGSGVGKTVMLFKLTSMDKKNIPAPAVYVPLFELVTAEKTITDLSEYFQSVSGIYREIGEGICNQAKQPWKHGPSLLVLLDGFNEVPGEIRWKLLSMLQQWQKRNPGAQFIVVSRPMDNLDLGNQLGDEVLSITMVPLSENLVRNYLLSLESEDIAVPAPDAPVWKTIVYPLFLNLYVKADRLRNQRTHMNYPLKVRDSIGAGSLIWNFLQRELLRQDNEDWILCCAIASECVAPAIAYHMLKNDDYTIGWRDAIQLIKQIILSLNAESLTNHITELVSHWENHHFSLNPPDFTKYKDWPNFMLRELGLLVPHGLSDSIGKPNDDVKFEFLHQSFRDCLAGVYLVNQAEVMQRKQMHTLPEDWQHGQSPIALDYAAELLDTSTIAALWNSCRLSQRYTHGCVPNHTSTYTLLELVKRSPVVSINLNFSEMDISDLSLTRYLGRGEVNLKLFRDPKNSIQTIIGPGTFESEGHSKTITCVAVFDDGRVVSGSDDFTLRVWDSTTGQCLQTMYGHSNKIVGVAVLKNGTVVSCSDDTTVRLWDSTTGQCLQIIMERVWEPVCITVLDDNRVVVATEKRLFVWDGEKTHELFLKKLLVDELRIIAFSNTAQILATSANGHSAVYEISEDGILLRRSRLNGHTQEVTCAAFLDNGKIVTGSKDRWIRVWDGKTGKSLKKFKGSPQSITCIVALPGGRIISGSNDCSLRMWDVTTGKPIQEKYAHKSRVTCVAVINDGRVVSGSSDRSLRIWNPTITDCLQSFDSPTLSINCLGVLPNGHIVSSSSDNTLRAWNPNGKCVQVIEIPGALVTCLAVLPNGLVACGTADGWCYICDIAKGLCSMPKLLHSKGITSIKVFPDGKVLTTSHDKNIKIWDEGINKCITTLRDHSKAVSCACILSNTVIVSGSYDNTLRIWNIFKNKPIKIINASDSRITCVASLSPKMVVSGSESGEICVWNILSGNRRNVTTAHTEIVSLEVLSSGQIVSGATDFEIKIWNSKLKGIGALHGHDARVKSLATTPDNLLISGGHDGTIRLWDVNEQQQIGVIEISEVPVIDMNFEKAKVSLSAGILLEQNGAIISGAEWI